MTFFLFKALLMSILPFYRVDFPLDHFPKEFTYVEYDGGQQTPAITINEGDEMHRSLKTLLSKEKGGWRYDVHTYANGHVFASSTMKINCLKNSLVVNYQDNPTDRDWVQISKDIEGTCPTIKQ